MRFIYKAKSLRDVRQGVIEAADRYSAVCKIIQTGYVPVDVEEERGAGATPHRKTAGLTASDATGFSPWLDAVLVRGVAIGHVPRTSGLAQLGPLTMSKASRIRLADLSAFLRQLSDLVDADIPLLRSLELIIRQTKNPMLKSVFQDLKSSVQDGHSLSQAMSLKRGVFPSYMISMIKAGELSGRIKTTFKRLSELAEKQEEIMARIKMSLAYPLMILAVGFLTVFVLMTFVMPRLAVMLDDLDQELPFITRALIGASHGLAMFWWVLPVILVLLAAAGIKKRQTPEGKLFFDRLLLKAPFFGEFIKIQEMARLARMLGVMLESGVEVTMAFHAVQGVLDNQVLKQEMGKIANAVIQGSGLAGGFGSSPVFPQAVISMIGVGEESGHADKGFLKWAENYERESERIMKTATTLLEPVMILILGGIVGFIVMAMLLPIFRMNLMVQ